MSNKYQFEELDRETRDYLMQAKESQGKGMPGIFSARSSNWPIFGLLAGFGIMILTLLFTFPPTDPPVKEALLQTAGFVLGGWMVVAAVRVWTSRKHAGHWVYVDPENLYEATGGAIRVTDLIDLRDAKAVQNFSNNSYSYTDVTIKVGKARHTFQVKDEERGRRMTVFMNAVSYMRDGGEDGRDDELRKLSPEAMGAVAKIVAKTGEFPSSVRDAEEAEVARIPQPRRDGRASSGILAILVTIVLGGLLFVVFKSINSPLRDAAIFDKVKNVPAKDQPPALRLYLSHPEFKAHRDEAQKMLDTHYDNGVKTHVNGSDPEMKNAFGEVILSLKSKPQPVVSMLTIEEGSPEGMVVSAPSREKVIQTKLADKWGSTLGDELVVFATPADPENPNIPDRKAKAMIEVRWKFVVNGAIEYTMYFRKSPDDQPLLSKTFTVPAVGEVEGAGKVDQTIQALANQILNVTVGNLRDRPPVITDF